MGFHDAKNADEIVGMHRMFSNRSAENSQKI